MWGCELNENQWSVMRGEGYAEVSRNTRGGGECFLLFLSFSPFLSVSETVPTTIQAWSQIFWIAFLSFYVNPDYWRGRVPLLLQMHIRAEQISYISLTIPNYWFNLLWSSSHFITKQSVNHASGKSSLQHNMCDLQFKIEAQRIVSSQ